MLFQAILEQIAIDRLARSGFLTNADSLSHYSIGARGLYLISESW